MGKVVPARTSPTLPPHPLALWCNYPVSKCPSASIAMTSTLRVNACSMCIVSYTAARNLWHFLFPFFVQPYTWLSESPWNRCYSMVLRSIHKMSVVDDIYGHLICHFMYALALNLCHVHNSIGSSCEKLFSKAEFLFLLSRLLKLPCQCYSDAPGNLGNLGSNKKFTYGLSWHRLWHMSHAYIKHIHVNGFAFHSHS